MSSEQNKALARRWVEEVINQHKLATIDETHASNYVNHFLPPNAPQGQEAEKHLTQMFIDAFPDGKFNIKDLFSEGDKVVMRYIYTGMHTGSFQGIPATGKKFSVGGINVLRVANGRLAENWVAFDVMGLMQQLGIAPAPPPAPAPVAPAARASGKHTSAEQNKELVRRVFEESFNQRKFAVIDELLAPDYVNYDFPTPTPGREGFKQVDQMFIASFSDMHVTIEDEIAEGNKVASRGYWTGTHKGELFGIPATGKAVKVKYTDIWSVADGLLLENWVQQDIMGMMQQLGVVPPPAQA